MSWQDLPGHHLLVRPGIPGGCIGPVFKLRVDARQPYPADLQVVQLSVDATAILPAVKVLLQRLLA